MILNGWAYINSSLWLRRTWIDYKLFDVPVKAQAYTQAAGSPWTIYREDAEENEFDGQFRWLYHDISSWRTLSYQPFHNLIPIHSSIRIINIYIYIYTDLSPKHKDIKTQTEAWKFYSDFGEEK